MSYTVSITNHISDLNLSPINTVFTDYFTALCCIRDLALKVIDDRDDISLVRSASKLTLLCGNGENCVLQAKSEHEGHSTYVSCYAPSDYVAATYGLDAIICGHSSELDIPYETVVFARKYANGYTASFWTQDKDIAFDESLAKKLIDDPKADVRKRKALINRAGSSECEYATDYFLVYTNKDCVIFQPSPELSVGCACNLDSTFVVEAKFVFDDGVVIPLTKTYQTGDMGAISVLDSFHEIHAALEWQLDEFIECFKGSANLIVRDDGITLIGASQEIGYAELEFERSDRAGLEDIKRALVSLRIVAIAEKIHCQEEKP